MVCFAAADSRGCGGGLAAAGAAANSFALVGEETWGCRTGALAVGFRSSVASCRHACAPDSFQLPRRTAPTMALLQAGHGGCRYCRGALDFVARDSLVLAAHAKPGFRSRSLRHRLADVVGRAHDQSGGVFDRRVSYLQRAGLQYEHSAGRRRHLDSGCWVWRTEEHREFIWRRLRPRR